MIVTTTPNPLHTIRICMAVVIAGLFISGVTAFPLQTELHWLAQLFAGNNGHLSLWIQKVHAAISYVNSHYPYLSYGTDWLAFAHIMLAVLFIGPYRNPVRNVWVIQFGIIACICIPLLAFIAGNIRGIPFYWQLVDCSFGVICIIPLIIAGRAVARLNERAVI